MDPNNTEGTTRRPRRIIRRSTAAAAAAAAEASVVHQDPQVDFSMMDPSAAQTSQLNRPPRRRQVSVSIAEPPSASPSILVRRGESAEAGERAPPSTDTSARLEGAEESTRRPRAVRRRPQQISIVASPSASPAGTPPTSPGQPPLALGVASPNTAAANAAAAAAARKPVIDRASFAAILFSAPVFANNIANRLLHTVLTEAREAEKQKKADGQQGGRGGGAAEQGTSSEAARLLGSDGNSLFGGSRMTMGSRYRDDRQTTSNRNPLELAGELTGTLEEAAEEVVKLLGEEERLLHRQEVRCKRVEILEKRRLAAVRLGLEGTSARLQLYENRVSNAQAATAGIEQHLAQSNARVQRGKSVSELLKFFKMFTSIHEGELAMLLKAISKARVMQRAAVTEKWAHGRVSPFHPKFYTTVVTASARDGLGGDEDMGGGLPGRSQPDLLEGTSMAPAPEAAPPAPGLKKPVRRGARRSIRRSIEPMEREAEAPAPLEPAEGGRPPRRLAGEVRSDGEGEDDSSGSDGDSDGAAPDLTKIRLHRAEAAAVAAGLDRLFAARSGTESQVMWSQRLILLAKELQGLTSNTENIGNYVAWLRQEIISDLFHVVTCFNDFYDEHPQTAVHQAYGRALLKTMDLISRLYTTLTTSNDALLSVFFNRAVNDLGVTLFSEWCPRPLPNQPPLPGTTPVLAMDYYKQSTEGDLQKTFDFLLRRVRRDVIVVETIFGVTSTARQQLLAQVTDGVVKPFISQQIKLAESHAALMVSGEATLTPRTRRRCAGRVADGIAYRYTIEVRLFTFFQDYMKELKKIFNANEVDFLHRYVDAIFTSREDYSAGRHELDLLQRHFTLLEEKYTRHLHPVPEEYFDVREAHMTKMKEVMDALTTVTRRVKDYAVAKDKGKCVYELVKATLLFTGAYLDAELRKSFDSLRGDRDYWRVKPKTEEELIKPSKPESQQCAFRMLLFAQSSLMSLGDAINVICMPLVQQTPRLVPDIEEARLTALDAVDERAERLLNLCVQAIVVKSLSILVHYQQKQDFMIKVDTKNGEQDAVAPPCTRACTLFCYYVTRQLDTAREFIKLSNGQLPQRQTSSQIAAGSAIGLAAQQEQQQQQEAVRASVAHAVRGSGTAPAPSFTSVTGGASGNMAGYAAANAVRTRARTMNLQQLLFGDGGPSSFVRTLGVCLYRGISAHLKSYTVNDRGALVYKQDVTAYKEAMAPLTRTPGLGGAVVEALFQLLKETSGLLIMPLDHIKEVKEHGSLRLLSQEEKMRYLKIRQDVRDALRVINQ